jgi:hypothetical protein
LIHVNAASGNGCYHQCRSSIFSLTAQAENLV